MNSVLSIFKWPDLIDKDEPFLEAVLRDFQGRCHYTPNLAQEIKPSRNQRQLIADKGSFDGGSNARGDGQASTAWCMVGSNPTLVSPRTTIKTVLTGRCFRYLDCFDGGPARPCVCWHKTSEDIGGLPRATFKAVYLLSQFDRKTDCFDGRSSGNGTVGSVTGQASRRIERQKHWGYPLLLNGICRQKQIWTTFKAVCGTQTRMPQGFKLATHDVFRPGRTGLRKTPSGWLTVNKIRKGHPGFMVSWTVKVKESPFLSRGL